MIWAVYKLIKIIKTTAALWNMRRAGFVFDRWNNDTSNFFKLRCFFKNERSTTVLFRLTSEQSKDFKIMEPSSPK